jgi:hypothetical protein
MQLAGDLQTFSLIYIRRSLQRLIRSSAIALGFLLPVAGALAIEPESAPSEINKVLPRWEDEIMNGYLPYHQLTVDDFPLIDTLDAHATFSVQPFVHHYYNCMSKMAKGGMIYAYVKEWTVFSGFNKNLSGRRRQFRAMKDELPYAQAILDLNEIYARKMAALEPGEFPSGSGATWASAMRQLETGVETLCQRQLAETRREADTFVRATNNGQNKRRVRELSAAIKKRLAQAQAAITPTPTPTPNPNAPPLYIPPPAQLSPSPRK